MVVMSGGKALIEALSREKVDVIFGIPGGALLPTYDVIYKSKIRHILARHEQCAAHMADGYARASGRAGVCMATSGPGATNLVTGIATAYMDSSPVVAITGQVPKFLIGKDAFQETDIIGVTTPITKHNFLIKRAKDIPRIVKEAFYIATTGRKAPVLMDFPKDAQIEKANVKFSDSVEIRGYKPPYEPHPLQVKRAAKMLTNAERPFIFAGGGVIAANASRELVALAELLNAPVGTSLLGKGSIPEDHPLSVGMVGMHGTKVANKIVLEADIVFAVGFRFSDRTTGKVKDFCPDAKIIHIDIDTAEIGKNVRVDLPIVADAKRALIAVRKAITEMAKKKKEMLWLNRLKELREQFSEKELKEKTGRFLYPPRLLKELRKIMPRNGIVATEIGQNQMWTSLFYHIYEPRTLVSSGGLGTMGFGFPASLGAKVAKPDVPVVDVAGDGSFIMTSQDLACSVMEHIPVTVIVLNNSMLGMVAQWQRMFYGRRYSQVQLNDVPDFVKLAEAYGAKGVRVGSINEFVKEAKKAMKSDLTTVIDVPVSPEEDVFPMVPGGWSLKDMFLDKKDAECRLKGSSR